MREHIEVLMAALAAGVRRRPRRGGQRRARRGGPRRARGTFVPTAYTVRTVVLAH